MALDNAFNRLKREIGIKRCIIIDGNVGDVYLNKKGQVLDLKTYLKQILNEMSYDNVICWDKVDGTKDDIGKLELVDEVQVEGDAYLENGELEDLLDSSIENNGNSGDAQLDTTDVKEMLNIVMKNLLNKNKMVAFILNLNSRVYYI